jgi:hypothetical protein
MNELTIKLWIAIAIIVIGMGVYCLLTHRKERRGLRAKYIGEIRAIIDVLKSCKTIDPCGTFLFIEGLKKEYGISAEDIGYVTKQILVLNIECLRARIGETEKLLGEHLAALCACFGTVPKSDSERDITARVVELYANAGAHYETKDFLEKMRKSLKDLEQMSIEMQNLDPKSFARADIYVPQNMNSLVED